MSEEIPTTSKTSDTDDKSDGPVENVRQLISDKLSLFSIDSDDSTTDKVIEDLTFDGLIEHWKKEGFKNIVTMVGAGISTSAGIPDFRSPGSGLYNNLQKYNLPHPSAIFEMDYFLDNPKPFFALAKELYPGTFDPTPSHYFVRLLHEKGLLLRHYTQNIDTLERVAGIPEDKLVEAHGTFFTNHCFSCLKQYSMAWMKEHIFADRLPTCEKCRSIVKPDIVFFGENLPHRFYMLPSKDFDSCDLLIIMGTSLEVQPFASLVDRAGPRCVRLLINRTRVGHEPGIFTWFESEPSLLYNSSKNMRDVAYIGDCDEGVKALVEALGWDDELKELMGKELELLHTQAERDKELRTATALRNVEETSTAPDSCTDTKDSTQKIAASLIKDDHNGQKD